MENTTEPFSTTEIALRTEHLTLYGKLAHWEKFGFRNNLWREVSSAGRALGLHPKGHRFDPYTSHHKLFHWCIHASDIRKVIGSIPILPTMKFSINMPEYADVAELAYAHAWGACSQKDWRFKSSRPHQNLTKSKCCSDLRILFRAPIHLVPRWWNWQTRMP